jgi:hypothetical protein
MTYFLAFLLTANNILSFLSLLVKNFFLVLFAEQFSC